MNAKQTSPLNRISALAPLLVAFGLSSPVFAQSQCAIPQSIPAMRAIFPPPGRAVNVPAIGQTLALSWSPQFCKEHKGAKKHAAQCGGRGFGFILHGLWADGPDIQNPQWCKRTKAVSPATLRRNFCATPSLDLMQHEWAKHGSCLADSAENYFEAATSAYYSLKWPDMNALSERKIDVGGFIEAFVAVNPDLTADMIRVDLTPLGWLDEVRICLSLNGRPRKCPPGYGGASNRASLRIWRAG